MYVYINVPTYARMFLRMRARWNTRMHGQARSLLRRRMRERRAKRFQMIIGHGNDNAREEANNQCYTNNHRARTYTNIIQCTPVERRTKEEQSDTPERHFQHHKARNHSLSQPSSEPTSTKQHRRQRHTRHKQHPWTTKGRNTEA